MLGMVREKKCNWVERSAAEIAFQQTSLSLLPEPPVCLSVSVGGKEWEVPCQSCSIDLQTQRKLLLLKKTQLFSHQSDAQRQECFHHERGGCARQG